MDEIIRRHKKIALQFSGGKDSLACLYLMERFWNVLTVYWLNTGDAFPETIERMARIRELVHNFVEIQGCQPQVIEQYGIPSDIVPANSTEMGILANGGHGVLIQDRYSCCARSLMIPMHQKMIDDGITLIIRGQKDSDRLKGSYKSGDVENGIQVFYPIESWTDERVLHYLKTCGRELPEFYEDMDQSPDCMTCSGYWEEGVSKYLKNHHPEHHKIYMFRLNQISHAVAAHTIEFNKEIEQ